MAGPWEKYAQQPATDDAPWSKYAPAPSSAPQDSYRGKILPLSREGNQVRFDPQAGIIGSLMRAFTLPQEVYAGKVDPMSDEGVARALEMGSVVTPTSPATRAGAEAIPGTRTVPQEVKQMPAAPTQEQLKAATDAGYKQMREMAVDYAPEAVAAMSGKIGTDLAKGGFTERTAPDTVSVLRELANGPKPAPGEKVVVPLNSLNDARAELGAIAGGGDKDAAAAAVAKRIISQFIKEPPQEAVLAGPAAAAGKVLGDATSNAAAGFRSQEIAGIGTRQQRRAAAANSGYNLDNAIRSRVATALEKIDDARGGGFTPAERAALEQVNQGTPIRNALREAGNTFGGGGGVGGVWAASAGAGAGAAIGGIPGAVVGAAAPPAVGRLAKVLGNRMTEKELMRVDELTRKRSALYDKLVANAPMIDGVDPEKRTALIRLLMMGHSPVGQYETGGGF